ncbi:DUF6985 domain-containing protein [Gymnodinialimonas ulvae]|uniref:DUF6985 domain-containing protein n=1 Tax=Gymnodinialimonas ulvae TaxID=3126504 RepID=UPI0030A7C80C
MNLPDVETDHIAMFDGAEIKRWPDPEPLPATGQALLSRFLVLPPETLAPVARHVYAYYRDTMELLDGDGWPDHPLPQIEKAEAIWPHVTPLAISLQEGSHTDEAWYVSVEANVPWEAEHGLQMVWRDGTEIVKVGRVDGHVTNADAYDDDNLANVVHKAMIEKWTTLRDV